MAKPKQKNELHDLHVQEIIEFWERLNLCPIHKNKLRDYIMDYGENHQNHPHITEEQGGFLQTHFPFGMDNFDDRLSEVYETQFFNYAQANVHMWDKFREYVKTLAAMQIQLNGFLLTFLSTDLGDPNLKYPKNNQQRRNSHIKIRNTLLLITCEYWETNFAPWPLFPRENAARPKALHGGKVILDALASVRPNDRPLSINTLKDIRKKRGKYLGAR